jgi:hypothetical protein
LGQIFLDLNRITHINKAYLSVDPKNGNLEDRLLNLEEVYDVNIYHLSDNQSALRINNIIIEVLWDKFMYLNSSDLSLMFYFS